MLITADARIEKRYQNEKENPWEPRAQRNPTNRKSTLMMEDTEGERIGSDLHLGKEIIATMEGALCSQAQDRRKHSTRDRCRVEGLRSMAGRNVEPEKGRNLVLDLNHDLHI